MIQEKLFEATLPRNSTQTQRNKAQFRSEAIASDKCELTKFRYHPRSESFVALRQSTASVGEGCTRLRNIRTHPLPCELYPLSNKTLNNYTRYNDRGFNACERVWSLLDATASLTSEVTRDGCTAGVVKASRLTLTWSCRSERRRPGVCAAASSSGVGRRPWGSFLRLSASSSVCKSYF